MADPAAAKQTAYLAQNCRDFGIELFDVLNPLQGIEHVVMPEIGMVLPGMVIGAGDSHTTTYGAFGTLAFGIGTSDIEHYLATQTLVYHRLKSMRVNVPGSLGPGVRAKDIVIALIHQIGAGGATGFAVEFAGAAIDTFTIEGRMTVCNMTVECGARGAIVAPDQRVLDYLQDRACVPKGELWDRATQTWTALRSDVDAVFDREVVLDASAIGPMVTWARAQTKQRQSAVTCPTPPRKPTQAAGATCCAPLPIWA